MSDFNPYPKIPRLENLKMWVTEKIDGTNAQVTVVEGTITQMGSRNRPITAEDDNHGFAAWVEANRAALEAVLPDGTHYGEWAGPGIQGNPLKLERRCWFLFRALPDTHPDCLDAAEAVGLRVAPILYVGTLNTDVALLVAERLHKTGSAVSGATGRPEGVVVSTLGTRFKILPSPGPKGQP